MTWPPDDIAEVTSILDDFGASWERAFPMIDLGEDQDLAQVYLVTVSSDGVDGLETALRADTENVDHTELNLRLELDLPAAAGSIFFRRSNKKPRPFSSASCLKRFLIWASTGLD